MRLLDLFCGAGGAAMGYHQAGFTEIVGVDIKPQPNYPFEFIKADALNPPYLMVRPKLGQSVLYGGSFVDLGDFDLVHASPPCQSYSLAMRHLAHPQPMLIDGVRDLLSTTNVPWVIENVPGAPLATSSDLFGAHGVMLCGSMFGLRIQRHRLFETSFPLTHQPCAHGEVWNPHNAGARLKFYEKYGRQDMEKVWREEMEVPWMGKYEAREAIPPAYTRFIGEAFLNQMSTIEGAT